VDEETLAQFLDLLLEELREHTRLLDELVVHVKELGVDVENLARRVDELADERPAAGAESVPMPAYVSRRPT
jgi:hypothetical protein